MRTYSEVNNMSWRVRPDDILLEVGRLFGSKTGLQKLNVEVNCFSIGSNSNNQQLVSSHKLAHCHVCTEFFIATNRFEFGPRINRQLYIITASTSVYNYWHLQRRTCGNQKSSKEKSMRNSFVVLTFIYYLFSSEEQK